MDHLFHTFFGDPKLDIRWMLSVGLTVKRIYTERHWMSAADRKRTILVWMAGRSMEIVWMRCASRDR